jgi:hypothetical protein
MSKECTEYDVRVALYKGTKAPLANIVFFNDTELMLECKRVTVARDGNRLYFCNGDSINGIKLTGKDANCLQLWSDYSKVRDLEGYYDLKYDKDSVLYYIDKQEKLSDYKHKFELRGAKQLNHNPGNREKRGEQVMTVSINDRGQKAAQNMPKQTVTKNASTNVVVKALIALLKTQVEGNEDALSTIDALKKFI